MGKEPAPCWDAERREVKRALSQFQSRLEKCREKNLFLDVRKSRGPAWEAFLSNELGFTVSHPAECRPALSTDGSVAPQPELQTDELLLGSGLLCAMHPENPSLCVEYPSAGQKLFSRHIPTMGMRGVGNTAQLLSFLR